MVDAKSIMGVMMLGAKKGSTLLLSAEGDDAEAAVKAKLSELINLFACTSFQFIRAVPKSSVLLASLINDVLMATDARFDRAVFAPEPPPAVVSA